MTIAQFNTLAFASSETVVTDEKHMINLVQNRAYTLTSLIGGRSPEEVFKASSELSGFAYLEKQDRGKRYDPASLQVEFSNPQLGTRMSAEWSFYYNHMGWSKTEIELNPQSMAGGKARRTRYLEVLQTKHQNLWQSVIDQIEDETWTPADFNAMRGVDAVSVPQSIPYFITEESDGLPLQVDESSVTNVQGIDPTAAGKSKWKNKVLNYASAGGPVAAAGDLVGQLIRMGTNLHFHALPMKTEFGERETMSDVAFCSDNGLGYITAALRIGQDTWNSREMAGYGLMLNGVAYTNIPALDDAALYATGGGSLATEATGGSATNTGPRFYFVTRDAIRTFFFKGQHFQMDEVERLTAAGRPNDYIQGVNVWNQNWLEDRRKCGIVAPTGSL